MNSKGGYLSKFPELTSRTINQTVDRSVEIALKITSPASEIPSTARPNANMSQNGNTFFHPSTTFFPIPPI
jgi:hypothetical protein